MNKNQKIILYIIIGVIPSICLMLLFGIENSNLLSFGVSIIPMVLGLVCFMI